MPRPLLGGALPWLSADVGPWLYVLAALFLISLLGFVHVGQASYVARQVEDMGKLESQLYELKHRNNTLRLRIAQREQMPWIKQQARAMGFSEPQHIEYVEVWVDEPPPAAGGGAEHEGRAPAPLALSQLPGWWHGALRQFSDWVRVGNSRAGQ